MNKDLSKNLTLKSTLVVRMKQLLITVLVLVPLVACSGEDDQERSAKSLSVFNVVTFPNSACGASNGYNGTCYTSSECSSLGGTASGTCASSFGVCCVFSIACGGSSSANNSYAVISSYSTSTDSDPCTYTFCPTNTDVCKLRIDFDTMVLTAPATVTAASAAVSITVGDCIYDTLTVSNPGGAVPPTICGYNTGQHMFVPASSQCNQINIDIDTLTTTTTRKWQIKVTQYECGNMMAPEQDCLQYLTASSGKAIAFNLPSIIEIIALQERLPASIGTQVPVLWLLLRPIYPASTTISASDEPGVIAPSVSLHTFPRLQLHLPLVLVLQAQALLF